MSLILDALKRAQGKLSPEVPILRSGRGSSPGRAPRWSAFPRKALIGGALIVPMVVSALFLMRFWQPTGRGMAQQPGKTAELGVRSPGSVTEPDRPPGGERGSRSVSPAPNQEASSLSSERSEGDSTGRDERSSSTETPERRLRESEELAGFGTDAWALRDSLGTAGAPQGQEQPPMAQLEERGRHFNLAVSYQERGAIEQALEEYQRALEENPSSAEIHNNLGLIYEDQGNLDEAVREFREALRIDSNYERAHNNLGVVLYQKGDLDGAVSEYREALRLNPGNFESYTNLGVIYKKQGVLDEAALAFRKALAINPLHAEAHYNLALVLEESGNIEEAIQYYEQFIGLCPDRYRPLAEKVRRRIQALSQE